MDNREDSISTSLTSTYIDGNGNGRRGGGGGQLLNEEDPDQDQDQDQDQKYYDAEDNQQIYANSHAAFPKPLRDIGFTTRVFIGFSAFFAMYVFLVLFVSCYALMTRPSKISGENNMEVQILWAQFVHIGVLGAVGPFLYAVQKASQDAMGKGTLTLIKWVMVLFVFLSWAVFLLDLVWRIVMFTCKSGFSSSKTCRFNGSVELWSQSQFNSQVFLIALSSIGTAMGLTYLFVVIVFFDEKGLMGKR